MARLLFKLFSPVPVQAIFTINNTISPCTLLEEGMIITVEGRKFLSIVDAGDFFCLHEEVKNSAIPYVIQKLLIVQL